MSLRRECIFNEMNGPTVLYSFSIPISILETIQIRRGCDEHRQNSDLMERYLQTVNVKSIHQRLMECSLSFTPSIISQYKTLSFVALWAGTTPHFSTISSWLQYGACAFKKNGSSTQKDRMFESPGRLRVPCQVCDDYYYQPLRHLHEMRGMTDHHVHDGCALHNSHL